MWRSSGGRDPDLLLDGLDERRRYAGPGDMGLHVGLEGLFPVEDGLELLVPADLVQKMLGLGLVQLVVDEKRNAMQQVVVHHSLLV